jgi:hypothetical protein
MIQGLASVELAYLRVLIQSKRRIERSHHLHVTARSGRNDALDEHCALYFRRIASDATSAWTSLNARRRLPPPLPGSRPEPLHGLMPVPVPRPSATPLIPAISWAGAGGTSIAPGGDSAAAARLLAGRDDVQRCTTDSWRRSLKRPRTAVVPRSAAVDRHPARPQELGQQVIVTAGSLPI